jgi:hypothetical protein
MRELGNCEGPISGEHLISEAVIDVLREGGEFTVSGLPWLAAGESKKLAPGNLIAKCLCKGHNSALSPLDGCAQLFFSTLKHCLEDAATPQALLISGHDLERWLLKTLKAMAVSGNLASGRQKLPGAFQRDVDIIQMLERPDGWPAATGLYFVMEPGARFTNNKRITIEPWYGDNRQKIVGLWTSFLGFEFVLMVASPDVERSPILKQWMHRPGRIEITVGRTTRLIELSWADRVEHAAITTKFDMSVHGGPTKT